MRYFEIIVTLFMISIYNNSVHVESCLVENELYFLTRYFLWNLHDEKY